MKPRYLLATFVATVAATSVVYPVVSEEENEAPVMAALDDVDGRVDEDIAIEGSCTDDGLPASPGAVSYTWTQTAGSGTCVFADDNDPTTTVACDEADDYTLTLTCTDGDLEDSDTLTASVSPLLYFDALSAGAQANVNQLYSVKHKLREAYAGNAYLARRHDTDGTQAIGFSGDLVDTAALATFCSGTTCSAQTLYGQGTGGYDLTNTTEANQPTVYTGGAVVVVGTSNSPAFSCDGTDFLSRTDSSGFAGAEAITYAFNWRRNSGTLDSTTLQVGTAGAGTAFVVFTFNPGTSWGNSIVSGNQRFTPNPAETTWAYHIAHKPASAQIGNSTFETNGAALSLGSNTNPTNTANIGTGATSLCALNSGANGMNGNGSTFITLQAELTGADLTMTRSFLAADN